MRLSRSRRFCGMPASIAVFHSEVVALLATRKSPALAVS